jgi:hypothetical protein
MSTVTMTSSQLAIQRRAGVLDTEVSRIPPHSAS